MFLSVKIQIGCDLPTGSALVIFIDELVDLLSLFFVVDMVASAITPSSRLYS